MKFMNHEVPSHQMKPGPGDCEVIFITERPVEANGFSLIKTPYQHSESLGTTNCHLKCVNQCFNCFLTDWSCELAGGGYDSMTILTIPYQNHKSIYMELAQATGISFIKSLYKPWLPLDFRLA